MSENFERDSEIENMKKRLKETEESDREVMERIKKEGFPVLQPRKGKSPEQRERRERIKVNTFRN